MCGICGFVDFRSKSNRDHLSSMLTSLRHRGPDDSGVEIFETDNAVIGFGHARLSIIDLSQGGHQPMQFEHLSIIYNGEIYNYQEIKNELLQVGHTFLSHSDTEVILHAFYEWGNEAVEKFIGMFAFLIYDKNNNTISAFVDRAGVKPLYYYYHNELILFGSELKALYAHGDFEKQIDLTSVVEYFKNVHQGYISAPNTIFRHTYKMEQGTNITFDLVTKQVTTEKYWDIKEFYNRPKLKIDYNEAKNEVHRLLKSATKYRMVADVPVGVFLSGGYDSTAVTSILQSQGSSKLRTFTIGFNEGNDESAAARAIASYLGTTHREYVCTTREAQEIVSTLPFFYDEPFADSSAIPSILVSRLAREEVTVALSADGGDEVFAGYESYRDILEQLNFLKKIPSNFRVPLRSLISIAEHAMPASKYVIRHKLDGFKKLMESVGTIRAADLFAAKNSMPIFFSERLLKFTKITNKGYVLDDLNYRDELDSLLILDYQRYLQNDILTKVDRATMSVSLEGREPLLDHRIVEFVSQLPMNYKIDKNSSKRILKDIVHEYVPSNMMNRRKTGFTIPIYSWLRGDLSYLLEEFLNDNSLAMSGLFNVSFVSAQVTYFKKGNFHYNPFIWKLLMFQMWYKRWM